MLSFLSIERLLTELHSDFPNIPKSCKTLLGNKHFEINEMGENGNYIHLNWINSIKKIFV